MMIQIGPMPEYWYASQWYEWLRENLPLMLICGLIFFAIIGLCCMAAGDGDGSK